MKEIFMAAAGFVVIFYILNVLLRIITNDRICFQRFAYMVKNKNIQLSSWEGCMYSLYWILFMAVLLSTGMIAESHLSEDINNIFIFIFIFLELLFGVAILPVYAFLHGRFMFAISFGVMYAIDAATLNGIARMIEYLIKTR